MAKKTLAAGLKAIADSKSGKPGPVAVAKKPTSETVMIGAHFDPEVRQALLKVRGNTGHSMRQVLGEAINLVCAKYKVPEPYTEEA